MSVSWTEEQKKVIDVRNKDILVSAAAGSGKQPYWWNGFYPWSAVTEKGIRV